MKESIMERESTLKLLIKFSVPAIIGMFVMAIYNLVDRIFIGQSPELGFLGLAAAAAAYPVMMITTALSLWTSNGGATLFSISWGAGNIEESKRYQSNSFILAVFIGFSIMILGNIFMSPILKLLGASKVVMPLAKEYLSIILFGSVFSTISMFGNNFSRAQGNATNAMISMLIGAGFNIIFDYILIIKMGMGMKGAAYATIGGQFLSAIWQLAFLFSNRSIVPLKIKEITFKIKDTIKTLVTGFPIFIVQAAASIVVSVLNKTAFIFGGDLGMSTIAILGSVQMLVQMPVVGFIQGQVPIISYNYGAKRYEKIIETLKYSMIASTIIMIIAFIVVQFFTKTVVLMFNNEKELIDMAIPALRVSFIAIPIIGIQAMNSSIFQATGQIKEASFLNLLRQIIILIPLIIILSNIIGLKGIFIAMPVADISSAVITLFMSYRFLKRLKLEFNR